MAFTNAWMEWIEEHMGEVPDKFFRSPNDEIGPDGELEGILTDENTKRLFGLCCYLRSVVAKRLTDHLEFHYLPDHDKQACETWLMETEKLRKRVDGVIEFFWQSVRHEFDMPDKSLGLCKDWQIVSFIPEGEWVEQELSDVIESIERNLGQEAVVLKEEKNAATDVRASHWCSLRGRFISAAFFMYYLFSQRTLKKSVIIILLLRF